MTHEEYPVLCPVKDRRSKDRQSGNHRIGTVTRHDLHCGCSELDWEPNEPPTTWFEYRPDVVPLTLGHERFYRFLRGDPSNPDAIIDAYCEDHGRVQFTVGAAVAGHAVRARKPPSPRRSG